ncbi:Abscisic acid G-protein coupled receptor-domain-containing protein [Exophiala viscosa]|uniref:Abscisic acid G-protein coupled receptor-domain-containing protein n=1 Tax=Exophiala viscosa TaxID=2486360 RepID=A0AAN6E944_9EURO|nr:Abscisic acid G-protein coupled receptor-domain-containing protein [Exophiala viscosa]KAI1628169.1 Abscisic acid G-protein coupled receptor-domain-containing protein [Exophiala viscosa]
MIPISPDADCDDCSPHGKHFGTKAAFSTVPFIATFAILTFVAYRKVYPLLSSSSSTKSQDGLKGLPRPATSPPEPATQQLARRVAATTFASTIALSAVLTELLLCEISNSFNPTARSVALQITVVSLLGLLVIAIPLLGISSVVSKSGYKFRGEKKNRVRLAWTLEFAGYSAFLFGFWAMGALLPQSPKITESLSRHDGLFQACLDRLGITGVSLMALLSGFASVSSIWQCFGPRVKPVADTDITRKQAGLDATMDMLAEKKEKLRILEQQSLDSPIQGFWGRTIGSIRGNKDIQERQTLGMETSGLETMASSLETSLTILRARRSTQLRATTPAGRLSLIFSYVFSCYCIYRICTTTINISRRIVSSRPATSSDTDPVTYTIALFARHVYPSLDQASWAQQISFLLSGAMLLASFTAVTQTFHLFSRFMPTVLHATKTNFALLISQISGMYVISSAIMLRGMMPKEVGSVINSALGAGLLEPAWVQRWFDGFFMLAVIATAVGIFLGRQLSGVATFEDDTGWDGVMEMGKQS